MTDQEISKLYTYISENDEEVTPEEVDFQAIIKKLNPSSIDELARAICLSDLYKDAPEFVMDHIEKPFSRDDPRTFLFKEDFFLYFRSSQEFSRVDDFRLWGILDLVRRRGRTNLANEIQKVKEKYSGFFSTFDLELFGFRYRPKSYYEKIAIRATSYVFRPDRSH